MGTAIKRKPSGFRNSDILAERRFDHMDVKHVSETDTREVDWVHEPLLLRHLEKYLAIVCWPAF
jgi:hypothetical protein